MSGTKIKVDGPIWRWDSTIYADEDISDYLVEWCKKNCKKWGFQGEHTKDGKLHFQMRYSLKEKARKPPFIKYDGKNSPTSKGITEATFYDYVTKDDSRVLEPRTNKDKVIYIPRQIREIKELRPWQKTILDMSVIWDTRKINYLYCPNGNIGKSILAGWCRAYQVGRVLPPVNDYKELMEIVCDCPTEKFYIIDMPRAIKKDKLYGFYSGIETLKDGYAFDRRYSFKEKVFDCPNILIFSNTKPDYEMLSKDRWNMWEVENEELVKYNHKKCLLDEGVESD